MVDVILFSAILFASTKPLLAGEATAPAPPAAATTTGTTAAIGPSSPAIAPCVPLACGAIRAGDQVWVVSTRCLGCPTGGTPTLQISLADGHGGWINSSLEAFLATDNASITTDVYVHGNDADSGIASSEGLLIYRQIVKNAPADRPTRFVIWSWPSDRQRHPIRTTRAHAHRADADGYYLGWFVSRIDRRVSIGLAGYSFGARVVSGAMHVLGGGRLAGQSLAAEAGSKPLVRAVLIAAAEDCDWMSPGRPNERAVPLVERMLLMNNYCDKALKKYRFIDPCTKPEALGYVGVGPVSQPEKIEQLNACCPAGTDHDWRRYFFNDALVSQMRPYLFLDGAK